MKLKELQKEVSAYSVLELDDEPNVTTGVHLSNDQRLPLLEDIWIEYVPKLEAIVEALESENKKLKGEINREKIGESLTPNLKVVAVVPEGESESIPIDEWLGGARQRVYLIQNGRSSHYKIGVSYDIKSRIGAIQNSNPNKVGIVHVIKPNEGLCALDIERMLHKHFKAYRVHNEWFKFKSEEVTECIEIMNKKGQPQDEEY